MRAPFPTPSSLALLALTLCAGAHSSAWASEPDWTEIPLDLQHFDVAEGAEARTDQLAGRDVLCINGEAFAKEVTLERGSVAVDIANDDRRRFANLIFRASSRHTYETAYLRMHKSGQPDAVQYTPHLNGETNWQLFGEAQARGDFGSGDWVTLRVDFSGDMAQVRMGTEDSEPVLVSRLTLPENDGGIGLRTLFEGCFSNFRYSQADPGIEAPATASDDGAEDGRIEQWSLSEAFSLESWEGLDAPLPRGVEWESARTEPNGRLLISRHRVKPSSGSFERNRIDGVYAGVTLRSDRAQNASLRIDASDMATVWLNGEPLFAFDNSFRAKGALFRGDFDESRQVLNLPLKRGRNELVILVAERANGWGLAGAVSAGNPVRIEPLQ